MTVSLAITIQIFLNSWLSGVLTSHDDRSKEFYRLAGDHYYDYNQPDSALYFAQQVIDLGLNYRYIGQSHYLRGYIFYQRGDYLNAADETYQATINFELADEKEQLADAYFHLGRIYQQSFYYTVAIEHYLKCLQLRNELGDVNKIGLALINLGISYYKHGDQLSAKESYIEAIRQFETLQNNVQIARLYNALGVLHQEDSAYQQADYYFREALEYSKGTEEEAMRQALVYNNLGISAFANGQMKDAKMYLSDASILMDSLNLHDFLPIAYNYLGKISLSEKDTSHALAFFEQAKTYGESKDNIQELMTALSHLKTIYRHKGQYEKAFSYSDVFEASVMPQIDLKEELFQMNARFQLALIEAKRNHQKIIKKAETRQAIIIWSFIVIISLALGYGLYITIKHNRLKDFMDLMGGVLKRD